ncbi:hypothetical protein chiPu_0027906, partial [Chiloscyllium punctatum]|nr:hypothetical protein [Chiloscyllium punctatum]
VGETSRAEGADRHDVARQRPRLGFKTGQDCQLSVLLLRKRSEADWPRGGEETRVRCSNTSDRAKGGIRLGPPVRDLRRGVGWGGGRDLKDCQRESSERERGHSSPLRRGVDTWKSPSRQLGRNSRATRVARDGAGERDSAGWLLFGCRDGAAGPNGLLMPWENRLPQDDLLTKRVSRVTAVVTQGGKIPQGGSGLGGTEGGKPSRWRASTLARRRRGGEPCGSRGRKVRVKNTPGRAGRCATCW